MDNLFLFTTTISKEVGRCEFKFKAPSERNKFSSSLRSIRSLHIFASFLITYLQRSCTCFWLLILAFPWLMYCTVLMWVSVCMSYVCTHYFSSLCCLSLFVWTPWKMRRDNSRGYLRNNEIKKKTFIVCMYGHVSIANLAVEKVYYYYIIRRNIIIRRQKKQE